MDECESKMTSDSFIKLTTHAIGLSIANMKASLKNLYKISLHQIQNSRKEDRKTADEIVDESLQHLISMNAVREIENESYALTPIANAAMIGKWYNVIFSYDLRDKTGRSKSILHSLCRGGGKTRINQSSNHLLEGSKRF